MKCKIYCWNAQGEIYLNPEEVAFLISDPNSWPYDPNMLWAHNQLEVEQQGCIHMERMLRDSG